VSTGRRLHTLLVMAAIAAAMVPEASAQGRKPPPIEGVTATGPGTPSTDPGAWPQFRGAGRDAVVPADQAKGLYRTWPAGGPKVLWTVEGLYMGYSAAAVHGGRVYFHDYDEQGEDHTPAGPRWIVRCVSLGDGREIWRWSYRRRIKPNHAVTRTVPATDGKVVVSFDPKAVLHAFDAASGERLWGYNLPVAFGSRIPPWYNGQCPLIDEGRVVIGVGGREVLMAAFDPATGKELWRTPNGAGHRLSHSSVSPAVIGGTRQYVWTTLRGMVGVDAADGRILWEALWRPAGAAVNDYAAAKPNVETVGWRTNTAVAPSPVVLGDGRIFMTAGYKAGSLMLRVTQGGDGAFAAKIKYTLSHEQFSSDCQTPALVGEHLYAVDHAADKAGRFTCLALDGEVVWRHADDTFGLGSWIVVGDVIFILDGDTGVLRMIEASPDGYKQLAEAPILGGHDVWAPLAYVNGKLICRDMGKMVCLEVGKPAE